MSDVVSSPIDTPLEVWGIEAASFPRHGTLREKLSFLVGYAILAPSGHNAQPWLFSIADDTIELYADRARALPVFDPEDRELTISCGAALLNLRLALRRFGYQDLLETLPDPAVDDLLANQVYQEWRDKKDQTERNQLYYLFRVSEASLNYS
jgi:hypothetical protein